jgi:ribosome-associated protein
MTAPTPPGQFRLAPGVSVAMSALTFATSRSSGPGGQNVNRTESKIEVRLAIGAIIGLTPRALDRLVLLAGERLTAEGELILVCDETRSQRRNRELVLERLAELVVEAKAVPKARRPTRPSYGSTQRRLEAKKANAGKKQDRNWSES